MWEKKNPQLPLCLQKEITGASQFCTKSFLAKVRFELIKNCWHPIFFLSLSSWSLSQNLSRLSLKFLSTVYSNYDNFQSVQALLQLRKARSSKAPRNAWVWASPLAGSAGTECDALGHGAGKDPALLCPPAQCCVLQSQTHACKRHVWAQGHRRKQHGNSRLWASFAVRSWPCPEVPAASSTSLQPAFSSENWISDKSRAGQLLNKSCYAGEVPSLFSPSLNKFPNSPWDPWKANTG